MQSRALVMTATLTLMASSPTRTVAQDVHVWQRLELTFNSERSFKNPYTDVRTWVDLKGPGFDKRVYGFWDGGTTFRVRVVATAPGPWTWTSGSDPKTVGLSGKTGSFVARDWTEAERQENPLRRGFLRPTSNHHALETADGTPFFVVGDTMFEQALSTIAQLSGSDRNPLIARLNKVRTISHNFGYGVGDDMDSLFAKCLRK